MKLFLHHGTSSSSAAQVLAAPARIEHRGVRYRHASRQRARFSFWREAHASRTWVTSSASTHKDIDISSDLANTERAKATRYRYVEDGISADVAAELPMLMLTNNR